MFYSSLRNCDFTILCHSLNLACPPKAYILARVPLSLTLNFFNIGDVVNPG